MKNALPIIAVVILWAGWFVTGGLNDLGIKQPDNSREPRTTAQTTTHTKPSLFKDRVIIKPTAGVYGNNPEREFIVLETPRANAGNISITDWVLKNSEGDELIIGSAAHTPRRHGINEERAVELAPDSRAIITTGESPIGVSFHANICSGFFEQHQLFAPPIEGTCPAPKEISKATGEILGAQCTAYIEKNVPACRTHTRPLPATLSEQCKTFITTQLSYNACVDTFSDAENFFTKNWRLYGNKQEEMWSSKTDLIRLYDASGNLVDSYAY